MRLSEAIRLGAMLRPQVRYFFFDRDGSCALGAACEAISLKEHDVMFYYGKGILEAFPILCARSVACPVCAATDTAFRIVGCHLNDKHEWTREAIADWVETIEPQEVSHADLDRLKTATPEHAR